MVPNYLTREVRAKQSRTVAVWTAKQQAKTV